MLSRVAESLYWMSRYIERAENNARIAEVNVQMLLDLTNQRGADPNQQWDPIISSLEENELFASLYPTPDGKAVIDFVSLQKKNPNSIVACLTRARENARTTSEQISSEMWEQINKLYLFAKSDAAKKLLRASPYEFFKRIIAGSHLFQGITDATMTHGEGWDFIRIGKLLERADCTSRLLDIKYHILLPSGEEVGGNVDTIQWMSVLRSCSALEAYRKIYFGQVAPWKVAEFIITHSAFPRSIRFAVDYFDAALGACKALTLKLYAQKHNPFVYFSSFANDPARMAKLLPDDGFAADLKGDLVRFTWISPDQCHDMHGVSPSARRALRKRTAEWWPRRCMMAA